MDTNRSKENGAETESHPSPQTVLPDTVFQSKCAGVAPRIVLPVIIGVTCGLLYGWAMFYVPKAGSPLAIVMEIPALPALVLTGLAAMLTGMHETQNISGIVTIAILSVAIEGGLIGILIQRTISKRRLAAKEERERPPVGK